MAQPCDESLSAFRLDDFDGDSDSDSEPSPEDGHSPAFPIQQMKPLWIEKYKPRHINDLVIHPQVYEKLQQMVTNRSIPNLIITGASGVGKTCTAYCLARRLLGPYYSTRMLEVSASSDRGTKNIQESVTMFCKKKLDIRKEDMHRVTHNKIILLDEADNMTTKGQQVINNIMEQYPNTRFVFTANTSADIIEAIQSRCVIMRYQPVDPTLMAQRLQHICDSEKIQYTDTGIQTLVVMSQGDLRMAVNMLQFTFNGYDKIDEDTVHKLSDLPHPMVIEKIFIHCMSKDFRQALQCLDELRNKGYSSDDISASMKLTAARTRVFASEDQRIAFKKIICETDLAISRNKGVNSPIQLTGCIARLSH